jgi:hypothetical protein
VALIFGVVKFGEGAWVVVVAAPFMIAGLLYLNRQYVREEEAFGAGGGSSALATSHNRIVVFVDQYDLATERALAYCNSLNPYSVRAIHFDIDPAVTRELEERWGRKGTASAAIPLEVMECEDRRVDRAALEVVSDMVRDPKVFAMVILPRRGFRSRIQRLLHDRTADSIATAVVNVPRTAATIVPYRMAPIHREHVTPDATDTLSDSVTRGGVREETHFEADDKLEARANEIGAVDIGTLKLRENAQIAGRVKSVTVERAGKRADLHLSDCRCFGFDQAGVPGSFGDSWCRTRSTSLN